MGRIIRCLIANRGEIAVRIARACRISGIEAVAAYSDADANALSVRVADRAVRIGGALLADSYLNIGALIDAARRAGCDAVHPGYGFLSESAAFAAAVIDAGMVWVGPPPDAIAAMGDKIDARRRMGAAGVPLPVGFEIDLTPQPPLHVEPEERTPFQEPHPLTPSLRSGEGEHKAETPPLHAVERGLGGEVNQGENQTCPPLSHVERESQHGVLLPLAVPERGSGGEVVFPVMVKAAAGGGGRGIRIVRDPSALAEAVEAAQREAKSAFGDARVFVEQYIERGRHIEVQILADAHGNIVHLGERECSAQRRHQKVIEESPSPLVDADLRARIGAAAVEAARAVGYVNAGTVEFIADARGAFYFLEMNTRLQVEHPVTEAVTGLDLVALQFSIANGDPLPFAQADIQLRGHAIEARLYAENPRAGFTPSAGRALAFSVPHLPGVRVDAGIERGDSISIHYDPMIAKIIAHDATRAGAIRKLDAALRATVLLGVDSNRDFLRALLAHPAFAAGDVDTTFIESHLDELIGGEIDGDTLNRALIAAALHDMNADARPVSTREPDASPWTRTDGFRIG